MPAENHTGMGGASAGKYVVGNKKGVGFKVEQSVGIHKNSIKSTSFLKITKSYIKFFHKNFHKSS